MQDGSRVFRLWLAIESLSDGTAITLQHSQHITLHTLQAKLFKTRSLSALDASIASEPLGLMLKASLNMKLRAVGVFLRCFLPGGACR